MLLDVDAATDVLWGVLGHVSADNLMRVRGWSAERYADFRVDAVDRLLLE